MDLGHTLFENHLILRVGYSCAWMHRSAHVCMHTCELDLKFAQGKQAGRAVGPALPSLLKRELWKVCCRRPCGLKQPLLGRASMSVSLEGRVVLFCLEQMV